MSEKNITRFITKDSAKREAFEHMLQKISDEGRISVELARKYGERALQGYELPNVLTMTREDKISNLDEILQNLRRLISPIIMSEKKLNRTMNIATLSFERMFEI